MDGSDRFWSKVNKTDTCWVWNACRNKDGYGQFRYNGRTVGAHRVSLLLAGNKIPTGIKVLHKCDNPPCVNPEHLFLGTQSDNVRDMLNKGRNGYVASEKAHSVKLIPTQVKAIRQEYKTNKNISSLARKYNMGWTSIKEIMTRQTWKDI